MTSGPAASTRMISPSSRRSSSKHLETREPYFHRVPDPGGPMDNGGGGARVAKALG
jgi:hypothetical protein